MWTKRTKLLAALAFIPALALAGDAEINGLRWLAGCWETPDKSAREVWVANGEHALAGFSVAIADNKVGFYEVMLIEQNEDGAWTFTAYPSGQFAASFVAVEITENSVVFVNPDHDYPQEIIYKREGIRLFATISLLGGGNPNSFDKIACE